MKKEKKNMVSLKEKVNQIADEKLRECMQKLPQDVEIAIRGCFRNLIGLDVSGKEIDHCNGRWNILAEVIKVEAVKDVADMIKRIKLDFNLAEFKDAFRKEYISQFKYQLKYHAEIEAKKLVEDYIRSQLDKIVLQKIEDWE